MYYNTRNNQLLIDCPLNGYFDDGTLVQGLDVMDFETKKACGILPVKTDNPSQPENSYEDISKRQVLIEDDGVIINRTYVQKEKIDSTILQTISARQIRLWLINNNMSLTSIESAINGIVNEQLRQKTLVEWEYVPYIERNHPLLDTLGKVLGLSSEQIDRAFLEASQL